MIRAPRFSRCKLLRGAGVTLALPLLEQMHAAPTAPKRTIFIYTPNGVILDSFNPKQTGAGFALTSTLEPLAGLEGHFSVLSRLDRTYVSGTGVHAQCGSCWLTSSAPTEAKDGGFPTDVSLDQILARQSSEDLAFASLELSTNNHTDNKETRYFESISWFAPGYAANVEKDPRQAFARLFGQRERDPLRASILDVVLGESQQMKRQLGVSDQRKLDEYLTSIRSVERRIQNAERATKAKPAAAIPQPPSMPEDRGAYIRLMMDLIVLAFAQDLTRTATLVIDPERWDSPRAYHGVFDKPEDHHQLTHTAGEESKQKLRAIDRFHVAQFAHLAGALKNTKEGPGSLLDSSLAIMGSGLGDGSVHSYKELPILMAGRAGGALRTGQHWSFPEGTPIANLWLTVLHACNHPQPRFADSTRLLTEILA
jgi:hypothetical protein